MKFSRNRGLFLRLVIFVLALLFAAPINAQDCNDSILQSMHSCSLRSSNSALKIGMSTRDSNNDTYLGFKIKHDDEELAVAANLIASFTRWIIEKTGWSASNSPLIKFLSNAQLTDMYLGRHGDSNAFQMHALYSRESHTIYLTNTWNSDDLFDRSLLLHELVHHLQMINNVKGACRAEYEAQAYHLQLAWLHEQGVHDPHRFLNLSELEIMAISECL